jgi:hypothetical protein
MFACALIILALGGCHGRGEVGTAKAGPGGELQTVQNAGGGTLILTSFPNLDEQTATIRVLRGLHRDFGDKPRPGKLLRDPKQHWLALTFDVKSAKDGKPYSGLILIGPSTGGQQTAVLFDEARRFPRTGPEMLATLFRPGQASSEASSQAPEEPASQAVEGGTQLARTNFPDNSGEVGLPRGWRITQSARGQGLAEGPSGERVALNISYQLVDPRSNVAQFAGSQPLARKGTDPVQAWQAALAARCRAMRNPVPSVVIVSAKPAPLGGVLVEGRMDRHDGIGVRVFQAQLVTLVTEGLATWTITETSYSLPQRLAAQERAMAMAMCKSYRIHDQVAAAQTNALAAQNKASFDASQVRHRAQQAQAQARNDAYWVRSDDKARINQTFTNYQRDQTVVSDGEGRHGTLDNSAAHSLVTHVPGFQVVPSGSFIKNIDY